MEEEDPAEAGEVREAYYLGRTTNNEKIVKFFDSYIHHFAYPVKGPYVESVEFRTPYEQVVLRSRARLNNGYDALDAAKDYAAHPNLVVVRILVFSTRSYSGPTTSSTAEGTELWTAEDFLRGFVFQVQQKQVIQPKTMARRANSEVVIHLAASKQSLNSTLTNLNQAPQ